MVIQNYIQKMLEKYNNDSLIVITDEQAKVFASTDYSRIDKHSTTAEYIIHNRQPSLIERVDEESSPNHLVYGTPIYHAEELFGVVVISSHSNVVENGNIIRSNIESILEFDKYNSGLISDNDRDQIGRLLLTDHIDQNKCILLMNKQEIDPSLLRTVIYIHLHFHKTSYFNINLNLGYESTIENHLHNIKVQIMNSRYLNTQDIVFSYDRNAIVVIKSFIPVSDHVRIYHAMDKICQSLGEELATNNAYIFRLAYGNLYSRIPDIKKSFNEAKATLQTGYQANDSYFFYKLEHILFENICQDLNPQIENKLLLPSLEKLKKKDGTIRTDLLSCGELYIDNCMNISQASKKGFMHRNTIHTRLEKLRELTGLDPTSSFKDAFIVKLLAVYLRQNENTKGLQEK